MNVITIDDQEFAKLRELIYQRFGITLGEGKRTLVVGRLNKLLRRNGLNSFREYYDFVTSDRTGKALSSLVDNISTNHTFFYREQAHFEFLLETVLPELTRAAQLSGDKKLRIWCAASSSGEEPYTLAMLLLEHLKNDISNWDTGVLATDISDSILKVAQKGVYSNKNVAALPVNLRKKYFKQTPDGAWQVCQEVKDLVLFRRLNLIRTDFPFNGKFHVIFARNVMIYFDEATRKPLVERFYRYTHDGGYLFIGHAETLSRENRLYRFIKPAVYQKDAQN